MVFNAARLRAIAHAQIRIALVRAEWHENNLRALLDGNAREFGKFDVVANLYRNLSLIRVKDFYLVSALNTPAIPLGSE